MTIKFPRGSYRVRGWVLSAPADFPLWSEREHVVDMAGDPREALFLFRRAMHDLPEGAMAVIPFAVVRTGPGPNRPDTVREVAA